MNQLDRASEDSLSSTSERVVIGMDPHKRSATIEVMTGDETIVGGGRFGTDRDGYPAMKAYAKQWPDRVWAIEGCHGIGRHIANRLLADGEQVVDVPPKLSARARVFATGQGRKTDATDANSVALVGTRMSGLRLVVDDEQLAVRILVDRRRSLGDDHTRMVSQLHQLMLELIPGGAKKDLSATQAKALLAKVRPRDAAGKTRRRVAAELIADLERIHQRKKAGRSTSRARHGVQGRADVALLCEAWRVRWCVMASDGAARPADRAIESLSRLLDGYFRDQSTGDVVLYEKPNQKIKAVGMLMGTAGVLRRAHMVKPGAPFDVFFQRAAMAMLLWWSIDEVRHGTTKYRKTIGAVTLFGALARTVQAELARATSGTYEGSREPINRPMPEESRGRGDRRHSTQSA
jgi:hypothetical protein